MSLHSKQIRAALNNGVHDGAVDRLPNNELGKAISFVEDALEPQRENLHQACIDDGSVDQVRSIGFVAGRILSSELLKIGERRKPQNQQLVTEIAHHIRGASDLEISLALGGSEDPPSIRLINYALPLLEMGHYFAEADAPVPKLRVVLPFQISSALNGLDYGTAALRAGQATGIVTRLAEQVFEPCVAKKIVFDELTIKELEAKNFEADTEHVHELLVDGPDGRPVVTAILKLLARATAKHAGHADDDLQLQILSGYAAAHGLSFHNYRYPEVTSAIKIGGHGEAPFDIVQQYFTERAHQAGDHVVNQSSGKPVLVNLRSRAGTLPPYYLEGPQELHIHSELPATLEDAQQHYQSHGLRSGEDLGFVPKRLLEKGIELLPIMRRMGILF